MLGDGELPSYEEPPCQECSPVPDYCSTGQTVLDPCGCCEECAKGEGDECGGLFGLYGTCADDLACVDNSEDPENVPGVCERTLDGCCDRKVRKRELGSAWRDVCTGRKGCPAALNTVLQQGKVIVLSVVGISYVYSCNIYNLRYSYEKLHSS